jgi:hypothetical protein
LGVIELELVVWGAIDVEVECEDDELETLDDSFIEVSDMRNLETGDGIKVCEQSWKDNVCHSPSFDAKRKR